MVFFGSGPLAAETLKSLIQSMDVTAVITKPQPPHGHRTLPPVIQIAQANDLKLYTPSTKQELADIFEQNEIENVLGIVVDYGIIIPKSVIDHFDKGIINSHFSLLPLWRGADPITFPLLQGDKKTGVSLMLINEAMDEGELIAIRSIDIDDTDDAITLTDKLLALSNQMLPEVTKSYLEGHIDPWPQDTSITPTYSRKLSKEDGQIDWSKPSIVIEREIRAFKIWPKSYANILDMDVIITEAHAETTDIDGAKIGQAECMKDVSRLLVYCGEGYLCVDRIKPTGKQEMDVKSFINGYC